MKADKKDKKRVKKINSIKRLQDEIEQRKEALLVTQKEVVGQGEVITKLKDMLRLAGDEIVNQRGLINKYETMSAPVNACEEAGPPRHPYQIFRVITNGKRYSVQKSRDGGETWLPEIERIKHAAGTEAGDVERRSYRAAVKYIRKQYGEKAIILPREWRAV